MQSLGKNIIFKQPEDTGPLHLEEIPSDARPQNNLKSTRQRKYEKLFLAQPEFREGGGALGEGTKPAVIHQSKLPLYTRTEKPRIKSQSCKLLKNFPQRHKER